jgi:hypothetical protein
MSRPGPVVTSVRIVPAGAASSARRRPLAPGQPRRAWHGTVVLHAVIMIADDNRDDTEVPAMAAAVRGEG